MIKKLLNEKTRFLKFAVVGLSGAVVNLALVWLGNTVFYANWDEPYKTWISNGLAIVVSIFTNYIFNFFWTWQDSRAKGIESFIMHLFKFYLVSLGAAVIQFLIANFLTYLLKITLFPAATEVTVFWKMGAAIIGIGFAMLANFILNHFWTFKQPGTEKGEQK